MEIGKVRPHGDRVLIEVLGREEVSPGGILLEATYGRSNRGRVVEVGAGRWLRKAQRRVPMSCKPGDVVTFDPYQVLFAIDALGQGRAENSEHPKPGEHAIVSESAAIYGVDE